jgi:hypothetical protein
MKPFHFLALALAFAINASAASAQGNPPQQASPNTGPMPMQHEMGMHPIGEMHEHAGMATAMMHGAGHSDGMPTEPGQAAFGAIQEIVRMLQADPMTNWSKVDIDALRQHLVDMNELTLHADAKKEPIEKGLRILVTGSGRTLEAIQRVVPAHAQDINGIYGWSVQAKAVPDGEELTVTGNGPTDEQKIRALGFMGIMVLGTHQMHHLAMAKGEMMHMQ